MKGEQLFSPGDPDQRQLISAGRMHPEMGREHTEKSNVYISLGNQ